MVHASNKPQTRQHQGMVPVSGMLSVSASELEQAWRVTHRCGAPALAWSQRMLVLSGLFAGRSSQWISSMDSRLRALEDLCTALGKEPDSAAFVAAAESPLFRAGNDLHLPPDTVW
jgi:hypothetical protein